jgi:hypothetical protein
MTRLAKMMLATSILLVSALLNPVMAGPSSRTATAGYGDEPPSQITIELGDDGVNFFLAISDRVPVEEGERFVSVEIADDSGEPVVGAVHQGKAELGVVCGDGAERFPLVNRKAIHVHLQTGMSVACSTGSTPSEGTVTLTFSN